MALSYISRVADGVQSQFDFPFGYLSKSHVFVFVEDTLAAFKWIGDFQVELLVIPLPGEKVTIRRLTDRANRVTTYTDGQTLLASSLNAGDLQTFFIAQEMIDQIEEGIVSGDVSVLNPGAGYITAQWIQDQLEANLAAAPQFDAIDSALVAEAIARAEAITAETLARGAAITAEAATRTAEVLALTQADAEAYDRLDVIETDLNTPTTGVKAKIVQYADTLADLEAGKAEASVVTALQAQVTGIDADVGAIETAATSLTSRVTTVEANKAEASALSALAARVTTAEGDINLAEAAITTEATTRAEADNASAIQITALTSRIGIAEADIATVEVAVATETSARASADTAIQAQVTATARTLATLNLNSRFEEGPAANGIVPYRWEQWASSPLLDIVPKPAGLGTGLCLRMNAVAGTPSVGTQQTSAANAIRGGESYRIRASVKLESGSMAASAILVVFYDAAFVGINQPPAASTFIALGSEADTAGLTSTTSTAGIRTFEKTVVAPSNASFYRLLALGSWGNAGTQPATSPLMYWFECAIEPVNGAIGAVNSLAARATSLESRVTTVEVGKAEASALTSLTAEVNTVKLSRGGTGPLPDPNKFDSVFWALQAGKTSFAEGNPFPQGVRSILIGDNLGLLDTMTQSFRVEPGATYQITFAYWNGFGTFSGYVRPMIHIPGVEWRNPVNNAGVNDTGAGGQAGDLTAGGVANSHAISLTIPGSVGYLQFRTRSSFTGASFYYRWVIEKLSAAEDTVARASITSEASARAAADTANATSIEVNRAQFSASELYPNLIADDFSAGPSYWRNGWVGTLGAYPQTRGYNLPGWFQPGVMNVAWMTVGMPALGTVQFADSHVYEPGQVATNAVKVVPGERLFLSALAAGHRCASIGLHVMYYNAAGNYLTDGQLAGANGGSSHPSLVQGTGGGSGLEQNFVRLFGFSTVPSDAAYATMFIRVSTRADAADPYLFWARPLMCKVPSDLTGEVPYSRQSANIAFLREAMATADASTARLMLAVNTATNVASIEAIAQEGSGVWNGSAITLQADLIRLLARNINFGTRTTFEDTRGTLYNVEAGRRLRILGPFGASNDLVLWYGNNSVALQAETKTNGVFAIATDGLVYLGASQLSAPPPRPTATNAVYTGPSGTNRTTSAASINLNGLPTPTSYSWSCGDSTVQVLTPNSATASFRIASLETDMQAAISCTIETSQGTFVCPGVARWTLTS